MARGKDPEQMGHSARPAAAPAFFKSFHLFLGVGVGGTSWYNRFFIYILE